ncbi:SNF2-related protein [Rhabdochlamydiaceae symbiont of Dictyostelium giganteum]|uniref:SNF2-related protein n=1 Tax=Rhabdochlamydiaceae symbiont of Dictyostelium giganteum TaxID=3342349 RepID=UPI00384C4A1B
MLNFRKLRQDFASGVVKEGKELYDKQKVVSARILHLDHKTVRIAGRIQGQYDNHYESHLEIDRLDCEAIDSDCDCPYNYDCQHLAALIFFLEDKLDEIMVSYSKENSLDAIVEKNELGDEEKSALMATFKVAKSKQSQKQEELFQKQLLQEYEISSEVLSISPFFRPEEAYEVDLAEVAFIFQIPPHLEGKHFIEFMIALRLPSRSKPLHIPQIKKFFDAVRYNDPLYIGSKKYHFSFSSFSPIQQDMMKLVIQQARFQEPVTSEKGYRIAQIDLELFGTLLSKTYQEAVKPYAESGYHPSDEETLELQGLFDSSLENPVKFSPSPVTLKFLLEYLKPPISKILLTPMIVADQKPLGIEEVKFLPCVTPGMIYQNTYYKFSSHITRRHLKNLRSLQDLTIPEPLFGSFIENAMPQLSHFGLIENDDTLNEVITIPYSTPLRALCDIVYLDGELEARLYFMYEGNKIPATSSLLSFAETTSFITPRGIIARNLVDERKLTEDLFQDFLFKQDEGLFVTKSEKKIVEFMTDIIPRYQKRVTFDCPQNLMDQFIYDKTEYLIQLLPTERVDSYQLQLEVKGSLKGAKMDLLWECVASKRAYLEIDPSKSKAKKSEGSRLPKILVLDLEKITALVQLFDELGIETLKDHTLQRPLWSLASIDMSHFEGLPVKITVSDRLLEIRQQMLGEKKMHSSVIPDEIRGSLRPYQQEGVQWLERLRSMYLNGILADDMGLGKTLQAIVTITQYLKHHQKPVLIVCPTSLVYNWKEECSKFNPHLNVLVVDGVPSLRKKLIETAKNYNIIVTSYTLLQKDIELYKQMTLGYTILDEAQHIKNRGTRNAKSVKMIVSDHKLILSGTPIENSLDEMWSLFDFLMPGFLSSYDRFVEKYVRSGADQSKNLEFLRRKVSPFILRRMKADVLDDLPPVNEIVYHCQLSDTQLQLYKSYAESARQELVKLVERDGFDRVQIHVLATLTRLKQICCHPAIFAKEKAEIGDSSKYDMLLELLQTLIEGKHKTVIFSQYTKMLQLMRDDLEMRGIRFVYLDGSSKNRLEIVKQFNEDETISVFLVSLRAGGTGLNLVGADTVIHYDMWWNPAVENQATDRVYRMGQKKNVSSYKLITLGTIEEKIAEMQKRKKGLVKKVVSCDDEAIAKLTWEDVLELLKT